MKTKWKLVFFSSVILLFAIFIFTKNDNKEVIMEKVILDDGNGISSTL